MLKSKKTIIISVVLYVLSAILSYFILTNTSLLETSGIIRNPIPEPKKTGGSTDGRVVFNDELPKTEVCPTNGAKYSKQQKQWWEKHRPLGVMIENSVDARPQSGLQYADVVYEAIAEGGITRFLGIFYCQDAGQIGPVRSARTYFVDFISEYGENPLYAHVGGANTPGPANALGQIADYGWRFYNDLDQFGVPFPVYRRIESINGRPVATEHTMFSNTSELWDYAAEKRKLTNVDEDGVSWNENFTEYQFSDKGTTGGSPATSISFEFWDGYKDFAVQWTYDQVKKAYLRKNGGVDHVDRNTKNPLAAKNIVILFMKESRANDGYEGNLHMLYGNKGTGQALVFMNGQEIKGKWSKKDRESRTVIRDLAGKEISFIPGLIWFEIVAPDTDVTVK